MGVCRGRVPHSDLEESGLGGLAVTILGARAIPAKRGLTFYL